MRLILSIFTVLLLSGSPLLAVDIGSPFEPVMAKSLENGEFRVIYYHAAQVKHPVLDAAGNEKQIVILSPQGMRKEPEMETRDLIGSTSWSDGSAETYIFLDIQGNIIPHKKALPKFNKEAPAVYLKVSFEEIKPFLTLFKSDTILIKSKVPPIIAPTIAPR